ncbi:hypothetical protein NPS01_14860 [Nocardioides psychrotolerans]|uniref:Uncharacterized protein n=1 Tax=Nocardioides psychrotolerans TaxID=1005945 RepID=A0A1I3F775_9ACTN|nr:hypothetical protein NPS01_14860 [Nocardioides psychrotolerans]SFI07023.1 hypothetical protein SAMN05216561_104255 [Nocardioides psychrotolerans]
MGVGGRPPAPVRHLSTGSSPVHATSLESDDVFSDGVSLQMATVTGSVGQGYTISLNVPV